MFFQPTLWQNLERVIQDVCPNYAIIDLRLNDGAGLDAVESIRKKKQIRKSLYLLGTVQSPQLQLK